MNINELSQDDFDALSPDIIRERALKEAEQSDDDDTEDHNIDDQGVEDKEVDPEDEDEETDPEDTDGDDDEDPTDEEDKEDQEEEESPKSKSKASKKNTQTQTDDVDVDAFYQEITSGFKAAGQEYSFKDPKEIRALLQKGVDYTRKSQALSHMRGLNDILTQNGLNDPTELGFLIDVKNGKPEAIAKLIQQHKLEGYELDEDKASTYTAPTVDIDSRAKAVALGDVVENYKDDANFNEVIQSARTWDEASQEYLIGNPTVFVELAKQKADGQYDQIIHELNRRNVVNPSKLPIMQQYIQIGSELFGQSGNGGSAHDTQQPQRQQQAKPVKERVIVKRGNVEKQRKSLAPTRSSSAKDKLGGNVPKTREDLNKLSQSEFDKLTPEMLRKIK